MAWTNPSANIYVPNACDPNEALDLTKVLVLAAHQDDVDIMAAHKIHEFIMTDKFLTGVVFTDGAGSPTVEPYDKMSPAQIAALRNVEQHRAAETGRYVAIQLGYSSSSISNREDADSKFENAVAETIAIIKRTKPEIIYVHNPFDKHPTHNAVTAVTFEALRRIDKEYMPKEIIGCEVWRGLNWLSMGPITQGLVRIMNMTKAVELFKDLISCHETQTSAKDYEMAIIGRWKENAILENPHKADPNISAISFGLDLKPFIEISRIAQTDAKEYFGRILEEFTQAALKNVGKSVPDTSISTLVSGSARIAPAFELPTRAYGVHGA